MTSANVSTGGRVQTVLDRDTLRALKAKARTHGHTLSGYIRHLVHNDLGRGAQ